MNKDVIYLDVDDDITTIVSKIKASPEKIVALVPPKRVGVLQSAVNMQLLTRTAEQAKKRIVLISNDHALAMLAAAASIPVAKNLQSKPEIAEIPALKIDESDVIDGSQLPVGEIARTAKPQQTAEDSAVAAVIASSAPTATVATRKSADKTGKKVPDFTIFRKKLVLIGGGAVLLLGCIIWAIWFAPRATVVITAKTTTVTVDDTVKLALDANTTPQDTAIRALKQEQKADVSVQFTATGKKNIGDKATGSVTFSTRSPGTKSIPAGTQLQNSGLTYVVASAVSVPSARTGFDCPGLICAGEATGKVVATEGGSKYNGASGSLTGSPDGVSARFNDATGGGTDKNATVVSEDDLKKAIDQLNDKKPADIRPALTKAFASSAVVIEESYREQRSDPQPSVAVGQEAPGPVTVTSSVTGIMMAIDQKDLATYLETSIKREIDGKKSQKIYDNGEKKVKFAQFAEAGGNFGVRLTTNATVGPSIDEKQVKEQAKGRSYGDIQQTLESIDGIDDVDTKFWPFWVRTVPSDAKRITVEFKLHNAS